MNSETHLFIVWDNASDHRMQIIEDIKKDLTILGIHDIEWSSAKFEENLTRFYRKRPNMADKADRVGRGHFTLIVVKDEKPMYENRHTSKGDEIVNINIFDRKEDYRNRTGPPNDLIHATNNEKETNHDLTLLLGLNCEDYNKLHPEERECIQGDIDLVGHNGWENISQMFYVLNNTIDYVVLRNWQPLPNQFTLEGHGDIDLLVDNLTDAVYILKASPVFPEPYRVHFKVRIKNMLIPFDLRYVGDDYYDINFEKDILKTKVQTRGFNTPNNYYHFYSLLYHAFIHKHNIKDDYKVVLANMSENYLASDFTQDAAADILREFLTKHKYNVTRAEPSVRWNEKGAHQIQNG